MAYTLNSFVLLYLGSLYVADASKINLHKLHTATVALSGNFTYLGCFTDTLASRTLSGATFNGATVTIDSCVSFCNGKGYVFAGTEYSGECYCGNSLGSSATNASNSDCSMPCSGNANQTCGGSNRISIYGNGQTPPPPPVTNPGPPGFSSLGCWVDNGNTRTLSTAMGVPGGAGALTVSLCSSSCIGYNYAGVEYSGECYCGNSLASGASAVNDGCIMVCNGNSSEFCGGSNRLNLYARLGVNTTLGAVPTTSSKTVTPVATTLPTGWSYKGCYVDGVNGRVFNNQQTDNSALTAESCVATCVGLGYSVVGLEYGVQCFCDNFLRNGGALAPQDSDCNMSCGGNSAEKCGAGNRLSVYSNATLQIYQPPLAQKTDLPGNWQYVGCMSDVAGNPTRTLLYRSVFEQNNTANDCLSLCSQFRYNAAGMEFGQECWCGDVANVGPNGGQLVAESDCNTPCSGNATQICGGGNRLSYYTWNSSTEDALYEWQFPTGAGAGQYQFYVPGVVVPLVTALGINGKITFLEKFGTGFPNTTGAYELDPSIVDAGGNWSLAWRPMHVNSDIFCSASLTLPDKGGRQINIGGWALSSTFGIRIYWPDGSPGQTSVNDWQESYPDVSLQNGRWYPSAMIMANGSILVVGGQDGSNGKPVPTLELLPKVGPVVTQDFLVRTDPYNLYPFLTVLPSGGIFIAYYNEARVMDEVTFATKKVLPNMPGAVNDFLGGRTYPFEGTMVLLPQSAPYTDPLTVLVCGGTIPGPEFALDNCVSAQPELAQPQWTIERMPSQRVISCMTALPDGTYLILNGAQQGRAGFGLASNPNLNAVLYDPSKPVHHRMSIMANTTVARLYHSEAILMQDGRILVSGSDPQEPNGTKYPEEFRVEVFVPPYILTNLPRPSYTIENKDWTYGSEIEIEITAGNVNNVKISLTGAEASTHGNSMGQRTIFPEFSCAGVTCSIIAPPNARVCPPGWFQLWVLDSGIPSHSTFVRIGGDPASLGNWPATGGFKLPGI